MRSKRVAVLVNRVYFMAGVLAIIRSHPGLKVASFAIDDGELHGKLSAFGPQVVVMDEGDPPARHNILKSLLDSHPNVTVVTVNSQENQVKAYFQRRVVGANGADLLGLIAGSRGHRRSPSAGGSVMTYT